MYVQPQSFLLSCIDCSSGSGIPRATLLVFPEFVAKYHSIVPEALRGFQRGVVGCWQAHPAGVSVEHVQVLYGGIIWTGGCSAVQKTCAGL